MSLSPRHVTVVVGMHRGGTSATTRALGALGVDLGKNLIGPGDCNETGYWEDREFVALNTEILRSLGSNWDRVAPLSRDALSPLSQRPIATRAMEFLAAKLDLGSPVGMPVGMKDPRVARLIPFWCDIFDRLNVRASWVIAYRNPLSVVRSLEARDSFDALKSFLLWLGHMVPALTDTAGQNRVVVDYDHLLDAPLIELERIAHALSLPLDPTNADVASYGSAFLRQRLRHSRFTHADLTKDRIAPTPVSDLNAVLGKMAADAPYCDTMEQAILGAARWLVQNQPFLSALDQREAALETARADSSSQSQRIATLEAALAERDVRQALLAMEERRTRDALAARSEADGRKIEELQAETAAQTEQIADLLTRNDALNFEVERSAKRIGALEAARTKQDKDLEAARDQIRSEEKKAGDLRAALAERDGEVRRLRQVVADREDLLADMQQSLPWRLGKIFHNLWRRPQPAAPRKRNPPPEMPAAFSQGEKPSVVMEDGHELSFHTADQPDVSIIIPAFKRFDETLACLRSISRHSGTEYTYEVIVADDGVDEPIAPRLPDTPGLTAYVNERNLGFLRNCLGGVKRARGRYFLFLNNDTIVQPGWLAPLVRLAEGDDTVGIVGCCLLDTDGRVQDAGWTILANGWGYPIGRGEPASLSEYSYVREVDCVGGACFLVAREAYEAAGGFDEAFAPAYYEEFDLAFAVRQHGYRVLVQPESRVVHTGSASYGQVERDRLSTINHGTFVKKWAKQLMDRPAGHEVKFRLHERQWDWPAILVVDDRIPEYDHHAGGLSTDQYLHLFRRIGWRVIFAPADGAARSPYAERLRRHGIEVVAQPDSLEAWLDRHGRSLAVIWSARPEVTQPLLPLFAATSDARILYFTHDLHYLREQRRYEVERDPAILVSAATVRAQEMSIFRSVDRIVSPSAKEAERILEDVPGVDSTFIPLYLYPPYQGEPPRAERFQGQREIIFVGGFPHRPNVDAAVWMAQEIMPLVWEQEPDVHLLLVGYAPPPEVEALACSRITVTGTVPDLDPYFQRAKISVSPLRYGAGVKGKIVAALASGLPVVTTSIGAEGIDLVNGVSALISDEARELAGQIVRLLRDDALCATLAGAGLRVVAEQFSEQAGARHLKRVLDFSATASAPPPQSAARAETAFDEDLAKRFCELP